jgi:hypothetical protein
MGERKLVKETTTRAYAGNKPPVKDFEDMEKEMDAFAKTARARAVERTLEGRRGKDRK